MKSKLIAACMALAAFVAFAVMPAVSSASPVITHPTGTVLATGTKIEATNIGVTKFTSSTLNTECSTATLTGTLVKNTTTGGGFEGEISTATFKGTGKEEDCTATGTFFTGSAAATPETGTNGLPWCIKNAAAGDNFELNGGACGGLTRGIRFGLDLTGLVTCTYEKTGGLTGTFRTDLTGSEDATAKLNSGQKFTRVSGFGCPSEGELDMEFTLETDVSPASPVYIST